MHRIRHLACAVALALTTSTAAVAAQSPAPAVSDSAVPTGQLPRTVMPTLVELELKLDPAQERFSGRTVVHADVAEATDVVWLHGRDLDIKSAEAVLADGSRVALDAKQVHVSGVLKLAAAQTLPAGKINIEIDFEAPYGNLMGAYRVKPKDQNYVVTQMEAIGARSTFPSFDEPSFKQPWDVTLIVPDADTAIANTLVEKT
ncbi:MAG: M1 family peptidase, partial [Lysobacter sp.]